MTKDNDIEHHSFGYKGNGQYACICGHLLTTLGLLDGDNAPGITSLKDQHRAHREEVER